MNRLIIAGAIVAIALVNFYHFPGHTWVQQDTQIYLPILEHLRDTSVLRGDILVQRPHVSFTVYDECALALRRVTGLSFEQVLEAQQLLTRALGIWGLYLMATAAGLGAAPALLVAAMLSLGAVVAGPTVLTFEYEPSPRAFAVPLLFLAAGMAAHARYLWSGVAAAAAFLIHPPTVYPFWGVYFVLALWPTKPEVMRRRLYGVVPLLAATLLLAVASRQQAGVGETQMFFTRLTPLQEQLQRMRASYVWVSTWAGGYLPQYAVLMTLLAAAYWRVRRALGFDLRMFLLGMPLVGILSVPLSWLLLERLKWALMPQFQPMRALLFVVVFGLFAAAVAGVRAMQQSRYAEGFAWLLLPYLVPMGPDYLSWPGPRRALVVVALAGITALAVRAEWRKSVWGKVAVAVAAAAGYLAIPGLAGVANYPRLHTPELAQVSQWARSHTSPDAVFLFADAGKGAAPGIFRADALRAVYVDWKGGGQVNYLRELGEQWWRRWQEAGMGRFKPSDLARLRQLPIDYLVLSAKDRLPGAAPEFQNAQYVVYAMRRPGTTGR